MSDDEPETFKRRRLDEDEDVDNDDESEEEVGTNTYGNRMDDDEEQDEEDIDEATDDELLDEIARDIKIAEEFEKEMSLLEIELRQNGSLNVNDTFNKTLYLNDARFDRFRNIGSQDTTYKMPGADLEIDPDAQLTTFQENIITTGSGASVVLLVILIIMFIIQFIRKVYEHFQRERIENSIESVLIEAEEERAEDLSMKPTAYAVYNTEFDERKEYERREREGADLEALQRILEKRAIRVILRGTKLQEDGPGIRKNWQLDMVPKEVWDDFCAAEINVKREFESIIQENAAKQFIWGKYGENVLQYAKEKIQFERHRQLMNLKRNNPQMVQQHPNLQRQAPRASSMLNTPSGPNQSNAPAGRNFGKGLKTGFLNNKQRPPPKEKLTRRQKKKLKQQQGEAAEGGQQQQQQQTAGDSNVYNPGGNEFNPQQQGQQTNPQRRKKGRRKFK